MTWDVQESEKTSREAGQAWVGQCPQHRLRLDSQREPGHGRRREATVETEMLDGKSSGLYQGRPESERSIPKAKALGLETHRGFFLLLTETHTLFICPWLVPIVFFLFQDPIHDPTWHLPIMSS